MQPSSNASEIRQRQRHALRAVRITVIVAIILAVFKLYAWWHAGAVSVAAAALDSLFDLVASLGNWIVLYYAARPADDDHRYGHGKAEYVFVLLEGAALLAASLLLMWHSVADLVDPQPWQPVVPEVWWALSAAAVGTFFLSLWHLRVIRLTGSAIIKADAMHYRLDLATYAALLLALLAADHGWSWLDGAVGCVISAHIAHGAFGLLRQAWDVLCDRELPEEDDQALVRLVEGSLDQGRVHRLRSRRAGAHNRVELELGLPGELTLEQVQPIVAQVTQTVREQTEVQDITVVAVPQKQRELS